MVTLLSLQKSAGFLCAPAGLLWACIIAVTVRLQLKHGWRCGLPLLLLTLAYSLAGNVHVGHALMHSLESKVPSSHEVPQTPFQAVFVFGGATEQDGFGRAQLACSGDRVVAAARLFHSGKAAMLVASGVSNDDPAGPRNLAEETRQIWLSLGIPESAILCIEAPCRVTRDEVSAFKALKQERGWTHTGVLSSAWHLPRILRLSKAIGLDSTPVGSDWRGRTHVWQPQDIIPQGAGFWRVNIAAWEYLGAFTGR